MTQNLNEDIFVAKAIKPTESLFMYVHCKNNWSVSSNIRKIIYDLCCGLLNLSLTQSTNKKYNGNISENFFYIS